jgi:2-dehydropantoate 2-reductase
MKEIRKIAVIGAGAMGCLYGGKLSAVADCAVCLIDVWQDHVNAINRDGLWMEEAAIAALAGEQGGASAQNFRRLRAVSDAAEAETADLAILFVKSTKTAEAIVAAQTVVGRDTIALTLQNGLGNAELIAAAMNPANVIAGTTAHGALMLGPGRMRHTGVGPTVIGELDGADSERIRAIQRLFAKAGLETRLSQNIQGLIWDKLLVNIGINALTALTGLRNGQVLDYPETEAILEAAVTEAFAIATAKGIQLSEANPVAHCKAVAKATAANKSSMLQDMERGRKTEIDMINGAIVREGVAVNIPTPVNEMLTNLIRFFERQSAGQKGTESRPDMV